MKIIRLFLFLCLSFISVFGGEIIHRPIIINESNMTVDGHFRVLHVADHTNMPAIIIGDACHVEPTFRVHDVVLKNFIVDGNKDNQKEEIWDFDIRANGITIRGCDNVTIQNCQIFNARSGGIVIEKSSRNIKIQNCMSSNNYFDGIAGCFSDSLEIDKCVLTFNRSAGLSFDLLMGHIAIRNCYVSRNDIGIFARDSSGYLIQSNLFNNSTYDLYFDQVNNDSSTRPFNLMVRGNSYTKSYLNIK